MNITKPHGHLPHTGMRMPPYGYTTDQHPRWNSTVADATENDWWATLIRGLKPTAKFSCRYAAEMRLQPTTNGPRPRVSVPRRRYPKIHIVMCGQSRHRRVEILPRRVATIEFSPAFQRRGTGFNPRITDAPMPPRRVATVEYHQTTRASPTHGNANATLRIHNGSTSTVEFNRR